MMPLTGLTVIAIEQAVAGPFASARLADAGAEVIKIERPEGDFARGYDDVAQGQASYFVWLNRGKTSVTLDLASPSLRCVPLSHSALAVDFSGLFCLAGLVLFSRTCIRAPST